MNDFESGAVFLTGQEQEDEVATDSELVGLPNPVELDADLTIDDVDHYKKPNCKFYLDCMNKAADLGWFQFDCNSCTAFEHKQPDATDFALARLIGSFVEEC